MTATVYGRRRAWVTVAIVGALAALALALTDGAEAKKKKPFKTGTYSGTSEQAQNNALQLDIKKKQVTLVFFEFYDPSCTYPCMQPQWAGLTGEIKKKKKKGEFKVQSPGNGYYGYVEGTVKGKKAEGTVRYDKGGYDPETPPLPIKWEAKRTGPSFFGAR
jgi:hypothetical protein